MSKRRHRTPPCPDPRANSRQWWLHCELWNVIEDQMASGLVQDGLALALVPAPGENVALLRETMAECA